MGQVQIISGVERRRRWSDEQKQAIVAAAFAPGAVVTEVARQADVNSGQIYRWRRDLQMSPPGFAEVVVSSVVDPSDISASVIDVALNDGTHVQIPATTPLELASAVIKALVRRWSRFRVMCGSGCRSDEPTCARA
jgi:transposase